MSRALNLLLTGLGIALACGRTAVGSVMPAGEVRELAVRRLDHPFPDGSRFPSLAADPGGAWIAFLVPAGEDRFRLQLSRFDGVTLQAPITVAEGDDWFVNWADFPAVAADGAHLAACWLQKLGADRFAYGVRVRCSQDGGVTWEEPFWLHTDRSPTEHGFPSLAPLGEGRFAAVWLDGRKLRSTANMTLRGVEFSAAGPLGAERLIDGRVCECCSTDLVITPAGPTAVYRGRDPVEIRDILLTRQQDGEWTRAAPVHADHWSIPG